MKKLTGAAIGNGLQMAAVVAIAVAVVRHEFFSGRSADAVSLQSVGLSKNQWQDVRSHGRWIGDSSAPVTVVMFADFECPACGRFDTSTLRAALRNHPGKIGVLFRHMPLSYHQNAYPAARASECAAAQGKFGEFADTIYAGQQMLGKRSYTDFARAAHIGDLPRFDLCDSSTDSLAAVKVDGVAAGAISVSFTPTIIVNGTQYGSVPDSAQFDKLIVAAIKKSSK